MFTPEDAQRLRFPTDAGFVGSRIFFGIAEVRDGVSRTSIRISARDGGSSSEFAPEFDDPRSASPSPSGDRLAFVADVDGVTRLCVGSVPGDDVEVYDEHPFAVVGAPSWSPSGDALAFSARSRPERDRSLPYRISRETFRYDGLGLVDDVTCDVYVLDLASRRVTRVTDDDARNTSPRWSPDGRSLLFVQEFPPDRAWEGRAELHVADLATGGRRVIVGADWGGVMAAEWAPDGQIVFAGTADVPGTAAIISSKTDLWTVAADGGRPRLLTAELPTGVGQWLEFDNPGFSGLHAIRIRFAASGDVLVSVQEGGDVAVARVPLAGGGAPELARVPGSVRLLADLDATGATLVVATTPTAPPEVLLVEADGTETDVSRLGSGAPAGADGAQLHRFAVPTSDGLVLDGWALTPPGSGPFPTVLAIHGGPFGSYGNTFIVDHHLLVSAGFAVVFGNFRGSGGYGNAFHGALEGRWGPNGEPDHLAIIDRAIELRLADPDRLGVTGISHGGFATCWMLGRTDRFRAGVAENPAVDWHSFVATTDAPWWVPTQLGGWPAENPAAAAELSPLSYAEHCDVPLLFIIGETDLRCAPTEAEQYFRVLKRRGIPTEMLRFPGEFHTGSWDGAPAVRRAQDEALVDWFTRYLL
jgi:dipeptidyl aminopeptidase/acylaminoacyl peptidase